MSDYTPTTDEMLDGYVTMKRREIPGDPILASIQALSEAERWLAAHDAEVRSHALNDAYWAVHVHRFDCTNGIRPVNSLYAGVQAAKYAISELNGTPIVRPWPIGDAS